MGDSDGKSLLPGRAAAGPHPEKQELVAKTVARQVTTSGDEQVDAAAQRQAGDAAVASGLAAFADAEEACRSKFPMSTDAVRLTVRKAVESARGAFASAVAQEKEPLHGPALETYRRKLDDSMAEWTGRDSDGTPGEVAVEIVEGSARLVRVRAASGRCAQLVEDNHRAILQRSGAVWDECVAPVLARAHAEPCGFASAADFDAASGAARQEALREVGPELEADFLHFLAGEPRRAAERDARQAVMLAAAAAIAGAQAEAAAARVRKEMEALLQAAKESQRRELKVVLDRARAVEERLAAAERCKDDPARVPSSPSPAPPAPSTPSAPAALSAAKAGAGAGAGASDGAGAEGADARVQRLEKKLEKGLRDASLSTCAEVAKARADAARVGEAAKADAAAQVDAAVALLRGGIADAAAQQRRELSEACGVLASEVSAVRGEVQEVSLAVAAARVEAAEELRAQDAHIAGNCRQMFALFEQRVAALDGALAGAPSRATLQQALQELRDDLHASIQASRADVLETVAPRIASAVDGVSGVAIRCDQNRDEIQALFGVLAAVPGLQGSSSFTSKLKLPSAPKFLSRSSRGDAGGGAGPPPS